MSREIEFYSSVEELEPVFLPLFERGSTALTFLGNSDPKLLEVPTFREMQDLISQGATVFRVAIPGITLMPPVIDSVMSKVTGEMRYYFVENLGGPFLEFDVPLVEKSGDTLRLKPGAFSRKRAYFADRTYSEALPDAGLKKELSTAARYIKKGFSKYLVGSGRAWFFSPRVLRGISDGVIELAGPLEGHRPTNKGTNGTEAINSVP